MPDTIDQEIEFQDAYEAWLKEAKIRDAAWMAAETVVLLEFQRLIDEAEFVEGPFTAITYGQYLRTETWRLRAARAKRWGYCQDCGIRTSKLHAHHLTYERIRHERPSDLIALCRFCHARRHRRR